MEISFGTEGVGNIKKRFIKMSGNGFNFEIRCRNDCYNCVAIHIVTGVPYYYDADILEEAIFWCESLKEPEINGAKEIIDAMEKGLDHMLFETEKDKRFARCVNHCIQLLKELLQGD